MPARKIKSEKQQNCEKSTARFKKEGEKVNLFKKYH
jgi:hypothetical protein